LSVHRDLVIDLLRGEEEQPRHRLGRLPADRPRHRDGISLVPPELTLDIADVVEPGLDLDDDQRSRSRLERQDVDPPVEAAVRDLELSRGEPSRTSESSLRVSRAAGMDEIPASPVYRIGGRATN
jgi:hypothetical protein